MLYLSHDRVVNLNEGLTGDPSTGQPGLVVPLGEGSVLKWSQRLVDLGNVPLVVSRTTRQDLDPWKGGVTMSNYSNHPRITRQDLDPWKGGVTMSNYSKSPSHHQAKNHLQSASVNVYSPSHQLFFFASSSSLQCCPSQFPPLIGHYLWQHPCYYL